MRRRRKNFGVEGKTGRVSSHSFAAAVLVQAQHTQAILPMKEDHMKNGQLRRKKFQTPESAKQAFRPGTGTKGPPFGFDCQPFPCPIRLIRPPASSISRWRSVTDRFICTVKPLVTFCTVTLPADSETSRRTSGRTISSSRSKRS